MANKKKININADVTFPAYFTPRDYQIPLLNALNNGAKRLVIVLPRRHGKDLTAFHGLVREALKIKGVYHYCLPTYTQAKKVIWDGITTEQRKFLEYIPDVLVKNYNSAELKLELMNDSIIQFIGTENLDAIRGTNPRGVVFSEYAYMAPDVFDAIYSPILRGNGGFAIFISTPLGMNHFYSMLLTAKQKVAEGNPEWFWQHQSSLELGVLTQYELDEERNRLPTHLFEQEYMCKFVDGASQFFKRVRENTYAENLEVRPQDNLYIGLDVANKNDSTVLTAVRYDGVVLLQEGWKGIDYPTQKLRIESFWLRHNRGETLMDATGSGGATFFQDLRETIGNIDEFIFTEQTRYDLLNNLRLMLEQDKIKIPDDPELHNQLLSFRVTYNTNPSGITKMRVSVPDHLHDDKVMSLALAVYGREFTNNPNKKPLAKIAVPKKVFSYLR